MRSFIRNSVMIIGLSIINGMAFADTPPSLKVPDTHSIESKGLITLYRVQIQGLEMGRDEENIDVEVFITLDSEPNMVFTLKVREDSPPVNTLIAETLRESYVAKIPVTIYHQIAPGKEERQDSYGTV